MCMSRLTHTDCRLTCNQRYREKLSLLAIPVNRAVRQKNGIHSIDGALKTPEDVD